MVVLVEVMQKLLSLDNTNLSTYNLNTMFVSTKKVHEKGSKNDRSYRSNSWHPEILPILFSLCI
jgi:hypothetical protein